MCLCVVLSSQTSPHGRSLWSKWQFCHQLIENVGWRGQLPKCVLLPSEHLLSPGHGLHGGQRKHRCADVPGRRASILSHKKTKKKPHKKSPQISPLLHIKFWLMLNIKLKCSCLNELAVKWVLCSVWLYTRRKQHKCGLPSPELLRGIV